MIFLNNSPERAHTIHVPFTDLYASTNRQEKGWIPSREFIENLREKAISIMNNQNQNNQNNQNKIQNQQNSNQNKSQSRNNQNQNQNKSQNSNNSQNNSQNSNNR